MYFDHVGVSVANLDAQVAWYCAAFELTEANRFEVPSLGLRGTFVVGDAGLAIELLERAGSKPGILAADQAEALLTRGYGHICLRVRDVDLLHTRLLAAGASERMPPQASPEPGVRMSFVADPEGNLIELVDRATAVGAARS
jgi:catechol 2,3-dioxygenase-like lactoylglutathione lyase family enzyme